MKNYRKILTGIAVGISCTLCACSGNGGYSLPQEYAEKVYSPKGVAAYEGESAYSGLDETGRYLVSDGVPLLMLGGQLRTDFFLQLEGKSIDELDKYFKLAGEMNVTVVQVPICWSDVEKEKGRYSTEYAEKYIEYCEKYRLKLELLWFGSWMCGVSVDGYLPDYVSEDMTAYEAINPYLYDGWLGKTYLLKPNGKALLEREKAAMKALMDGIYEYDRMNGGRHTVVGIQVENEPDMLLAPHSKDYPDTFGYTASEVCDMLTAHLDELGRVVKASPYRCYTRVNLTDREYLSYLTETLPATEGIDFVGLDPYNNSVSKIGAQLDALKAEGNFAHIAENGGEYENNDQLELLAFTKGCGYEVFEVVCTYSPELADWELRGVYNTDFTKKPHTQRLIDANRIYRDGFLDIVKAGAEGRLLGFNLLNSGGSDSIEQTLEVGDTKVTHSTAQRGIAYAAVRDKVITLASTKEDTFTVNKKVLYGERGYYTSDGVWHKEAEVSVKKGKIKVDGTKVYRLLVE